MPRKYEFYTNVGDGPDAIQLGYSSKEREGLQAVVFIDAEGKRIEKRTSCKSVDGRYHIEAARIIARAYASVYETEAIEPTSWDDAMTEVERTAPGLRPPTLLAFKKAIKQLRKTLGEDKKKVSGPADITPELATRFSRLFLSTTYRRGNSQIDRKRSPVTLSYYVRSLSALWGQFLDLEYVRSNPWSSVRRPKLEKKNKYVPTEQEIICFFKWIKEKYPGWDRLDVLLRLKLRSGCRTADICQLKTNQLQKGQLRFLASQTKTKEDRNVPLDDALFEKATSVAGKVWLWERWVEDCKKFRHSANDRKLSDKFKASTVDYVLRNIFREYSDANPTLPRMTPHAFRRYAITAMVTATGNVDMTALALGINAQTARTYYLAAKQAFKTEDAFKMAAEKLNPKLD